MANISFTNWAGQRRFVAPEREISCFARRSHVWTAAISRLANGDIVIALGAGRPGAAGVEGLGGIIECSVFGRIRILSRESERVNALWPAGGRDDEPGALAPSISRRYGLARVARVWNVSRAGVYRFRSAVGHDRVSSWSRRSMFGRGTGGTYPPTDHRLRLSRRRLPQDMGGLRFAGVRASPRRVRRVMGEHGLLAAHRAGRAEAKAHDGTIVTDKVNEMWGTDMTQTITIGEGRAYVFVAVEHANSEVVGIHAARSANRFEALEPVRQGVHRCFGAIAPGVARGLKLRHDHGSNYMSGDFQDEIKCLGIEASPSFVREPEGNGVAERFMRTLKENLLWVKTFETIEQLRAALVEFATRYNETWLVARHGYKTPAQVRGEQTTPQPAIDQSIDQALSLAA